MSVARDNYFVSIFSSIEEIRILDISFIFAKVIQDFQIKSRERISYNRVDEKYERKGNLFNRIFSSTLFDKKLYN